MSLPIEFHKIWTTVEEQIVKSSRALKLRYEEEWEV
jgi:hypothetical protein